ncbi:MAG: hypothetical protein WD696_11960 [Bryobacteraceae bacterium]
MKTIVAPTYSLAKAATGSAYTTAELMPPFQTELSVLTEGTPLEFESAGETKDLPVPIPRLAGLDDIELDRVDFRLASEARSQDVSVAGSPANGEVVIALSGPSAAASSLESVEIENLRVEATEAESFVLERNAGFGLLRVWYEWDVDESESIVVLDGGAGTAKHLHLLVRAGSGGGFGPPAAAAPHFAMPGAGSGLYGPALGGAALQVTQEGDDKVNAICRFHPPIPGNRFAILIGHANQMAANAGLPNEVAAVNWSAANVRGVFDVRAQSVSVKATAGEAAPEQPVVAEFPSDPGGKFVAVDFAGVARSLLKQAYPNSTGDDMGLKLLFTAGSPANLRVALGSAAARFLGRPLEHGPAPLKLLGAAEFVDLAVSDAYRPAAISFTIDGTYGPSRLTLDSDTGVPDSRRGLRVGGTAWVARRIALTAAEANLPITRLAVYGRSGEKCELLLTLHQGDAVRVGPRVGEPLSLEIAPTPDASWHRKEFAAPGLLPPHSAALWLVARTTRGTFWWHGPLDVSGDTQRSPDEGATFTEVSGRPSAHVSVREVDSATGLPSPVHPLALSWQNGLLNADVVGVAGVEASVPPDFRRFWIAEGAEHATFLQNIPGLGGRLRLSFSCQRDVDLNVSDAVLTYDPWNP